VQHGASTLPEDAFHNFPKRETAEIHLATNFQNMFFDHLPATLRDEMYAWLRENAKDERKAGDTDEQFFYKSRKKAIGPFKRQLWELPAEARRAVDTLYDRKFRFLFDQLAIGGTKDIVARYVKPATVHRPLPADATPVHAAAPDDADLSD
jgi:hypothetical protein